MVLLDILKILPFEGFLDLQGVFLDDASGWQCSWPILFDSRYIWITFLVLFRKRVTLIGAFGACMVTPLSTIYQNIFITTINLNLEYIKVFEVLKEK